MTRSLSTMGAALTLGVLLAVPGVAAAMTRGDTAVTAQVVDVHSGRPLAGAEVSAYTSSRLPFERATTNAAGRVTLKNLTKGSYRVLIVKPGYQTMAYTIHVRSNRTQQSAGRLAVYPSTDRPLPPRLSGVTCGHPMHRARTSDVYVICG